MGTYALFVVLVVVTRAGRGRTPLARINQMHLRMGVVYLLVAAGQLAWQRRWPGAMECADWAVGGFVYFGVHYAICVNFFVLAQASVSSALISIIHAHGGRATRRDCEREYAGGAGFGYIKQHRLARIENFLGWVESSGGKYRLTRIGRGMARLTRWLLGLWGLRQLGRTG